MNRKEVEEYILSFPGATLTYPFGEDVAVYKVPVGNEEKMFALMPEGKEPATLSLKCDPQLAELLREKYVSVMPGYHLNKKHWNTIVLGQELPWEEVQGFITLSHNLVVGQATS